MRELAILIFQTLDGVMESPMIPNEDRSGDFESGGWANPYWEDVMTHVGREAMSEPYDIVFGRKTYDAFAAFWPNVKDDPAADILNGARKYVVSGGSPELNWNNSHLVSGDISTEFRALKEQSGPLLQVHGSATLLQTLFAHELVDELRLWTFPVTVGRGKRLFESGTTASEFKLKKCESLPNGVMMTIYTRVQT